MTPPPLPPPADALVPTPAAPADDVQDENDLLTWMSWSAAIAMNA